MNSDGSFLNTVIDQVRTYLDDSDITSKYSGDALFRQFIMPATSDVYGRINTVMQCKLINQFSLTITSGTTRYRLPPSVGEVKRIVTLDDDGNVLSDAIPEDLLHAWGPGWRLEGVGGAMDLVFDASPYVSTVSVWYVSNHNFYPVLGTATAAATTTTSFTHTSLTLGQLDQRQNAYAGAVFRWLTSTATEYWHEAMISTYAYTASNWTYTLRDSLTVEDTSAHTYEVAPPASVCLWDSIALAAVMRLATVKQVSRVQMEHYRQCYRQSLKTCLDHVTMIQTRKPPHITKDTLDRPLGWRV